MGTKELFGFAFFTFGVIGGVALTCASKRIRDLFFVLMVFLSPLTEYYDINFVSRDWYRGTVRGFELSLVDILAISVLLGCMLAPRRGQVRGFLPASLGLILFYFFYCCFNVALADPKLFGLFELSKLMRGLIVFLAAAFYLQSERELRVLLITLGALVCYQGLLCIKQRYWDHEHRTIGSIGDSNSLSFFFCITAPVLAAACTSRLPKKLKVLCAAGIVLACVGVILTITRMGVVTMGIVLLGIAVATVSIRITAQKVIVAVLVLIGVAGVLAKSWETLQSRFSESNLQDEYGNKKAMGRGYYIRLARDMGREHLFGVGLNNWSYWVSGKYGPRHGYRFAPYKGTDIEPSLIMRPDANTDQPQAAPAHSLAALTVGELGYPGLFVLALLWLRWFQMGFVFLWKRTPEPMRRIGVGLFFALVGMFVHSLTEWVFRHSPVSYIIHILLGALAGLYYVRKKEKRAVAFEREPEPDVVHIYSPQPYSEPTV